MTIHIMTDIETMSTNSHGLILTIGACAFDIDAGDMKEMFGVKLNIADSKELGFIVDQSTVDWWNKQSIEAQRAAFDTEGSVPVKEALDLYGKWLIKMRESDPRMEMNMWANDPDFDLVMLRNAFERVNLLAPWQYYEHRSMRTMVDISKNILGIDKKTFKREGTNHNATHDAVHQAKIVTTIWNKLK